MFRYKRGINLPHDEQGLIYFTCLTHQKQPQKTQDKILNMCLEIGGDDYQALYDVVTTHKSIVQIALEYFVSESNLYRFRKQFYEQW